MNIEEKAKAYDRALEQAKKELNTCGSLDCDAARQIFRFFPELREEEKPLTPFQQCLNCILRGVYYAEVPDKKVNEFILSVVRTRTDELIKLAKIHEYTNCQLRESEDFDEEVRKWLVGYFSSIKDTVWIHRNTITCEQILEWLEKQKEPKPFKWTDLTWKDIVELEGIINNVHYEFRNGIGQESFGKEVLEKFREYKGDEYLDEKEQKPNSTEDMPYITDEHFYEREPADSFKYKLAEYMTRCCTKKEGSYGYTYGISAESILQMAKEELIKRGELKEQKPAECIEDSVKFEEGFKVGRESGLRDGQKYVLNNLDSYGLCKPAWSEDDEKNLELVIDCVYDFYPDPVMKYKLKDWLTQRLKSLRTCPSWKPSDHQMNILKAVKEYVGRGSGYWGEGLGSLIEDLEKLI